MTWCNLALLEGGAPYGCAIRLYSQVGELTQRQDAMCSQLYFTY
jgi:hypothetical protein